MFFVFLSLTISLLFSTPVLADEDYTFMTDDANLGQLQKEIRSSGIPIHGVTKTGSQVTVHVKGALSSEGMTTLGQVVDSHVPKEEVILTPDNWKSRYASAASVNQKLEVIAQYLGLQD